MCIENNYVYKLWCLLVIIIMQFSCNHTGCTGAVHIMVLEVLDKYKICDGYLCRLTEVPVKYMKYDRVVCISKGILQIMGMTS